MHGGMGTFRLCSWSRGRHARAAAWQARVDRTHMRRFGRTMPAGQTTRVGTLAFRHAADGALRIGLLRTGIHRAIHSAPPSIQISAIWWDEFCFGRLSPHAPTGGTKEIP